MPPIKINIAPIHSKIIINLAYAFNLLESVLEAVKATKNVKVIKNKNGKIENIKYPLILPP
jgi:hypothetical protein